MTIEFWVVPWIFISHGAFAVRLIKCTLTLIWPFYGVNGLVRYLHDFLSLFNHRFNLHLVGSL
jgi:hypothetical protein